MPCSGRRGCPALDLNNAFEVMHPNPCGKDLENYHSSQGMPSFFLHTWCTTGAQVCLSRDAAVSKLSCRCLSRNFFLLLTRYHKPCREPPCACRKIVASAMCNFICNMVLKRLQSHSTGACGSTATFHGAHVTVPRIINASPVGVGMPTAERLF